MTERPEGHVRALVVPVDGPAVLGWLEPSLDALRAAIGGGWLEGVDGPGWHGYCDEEGKLKRLPANLPATALAHACGWPYAADLLCGPVVFLGNDPEGEEADVPQHVVAVWREMSTPE